MICPECKEEGCIRTLTKEPWRYNLEGCTRKALDIARKERDGANHILDLCLAERDAALARVKVLESALDTAANSLEWINIGTSVQTEEMSAMDALIERRAFAGFRALAARAALAKETP